MTEQVEYNISEFKSEIEKTELFQEYILRLEDDFLLRFLKVAKNDVKQALEKYKSHYNMLINFPKVETLTKKGRTLNDISWLINSLEDLDKNIVEKFGYPGMGFYGIDSFNRCVIAMDAEPFNYLIDHPEILDCCLYGTVLLYDFVLEKYSENAFTHGFIIMDDHKAMSSKIGKFFMQNLEFMKNFSNIISSGMPIKMSKYCLLNGPWILRIMFKCFSPFLSEKIKSRTGFLYTKELEEEVGNVNLPKFLGGEKDFISYNDNLNIGEQFLKIFPEKRENETQVTE